MFAGYFTDDVGHMVVPSHIDFCRIQNAKHINVELTNKNWK